MAAYPATTQRTLALEIRICIGTGFHNKWYRSQREHWLGWLVAKDCEARKRERNPKEIAAAERWRWLMCSPAMLWLAGSAGVEASLLDLAEDAAVRAAAINDKDGQPHGKFIREVLPWEIVKAAILAGSLPAPADQSKIDALAAFDRLCERRSKHK